MFMGESVFLFWKMSLDLYHISISFVSQVERFWIRKQVALQHTVLVQDITEKSTALVQVQANTTLQDSVQKVNTSFLNRKSRSREAITVETYMENNEIVV